MSISVTIQCMQRVLPSQRGAVAVPQDGDSLLEECVVKR